LALLDKKKPGDNSSQQPGFFRYLAIIAYDALLLIALLFLATALLLPLNHGEAFNSSQYFFPLYIICISFIYYGWFWTHGGQTLGMKTWKVRIKTFNNQKITWTLACKRFFLACLSWGALGLGILWVLIDKKHQSWHDKLSKTALFFESND